MVSRWSSLAVRTGLSQTGRALHAVPVRQWKTRHRLIQRSIVWAVFCVWYILLSASIPTSTTYAQQSAQEAVWWLDSLEILSRAEWGADETWRYADSGYYDWSLEQTRLYNERLAWRGVDRWWRFAARKANAELLANRSQALRTLYPRDNGIDRTVTQEDGHALMWPLSYKNQKHKIVIHHTADSNGKYTTPEEYMSGVQNIYKFHAHTRWWGDIGYNFLIDPYGTIYEGRAGGAGVVWAHAEWNNADTIGIALIGNYDTIEPTPEMKEALTRLVTVLSMTYNIDLDAEQTYYQVLSQEPWVETKTMSSFVWHGDIRATVCPGRHVRRYMPEIKAKAQHYKEIFRQLGRIDFATVQQHSLPNAHFFSSSRGTITVPLIGVDPMSTCSSLVSWVQIRSCNIFPGHVDIHIGRRQYPASGRQAFMLQWNGMVYMIDASVVWQEDLLQLRNDKEAQYIRAFGRPTTPATMQKVDIHQPVSRIPALRALPARVLLYEITAEQPTRDMLCSERCTVRMDNATIENARMINVLKNTQWTLDVFVDTRRHTSSYVEILNPRGEITFGNYARRSFAGIPRNVFRGDITIRQEQYRHLDRGMITDYTVVNTLPFEQYMRGIAEVSDQEHIEKIKALALLVQAYALYYITWENKHPSIPAWASYTMVDDARIFQKYVGAGYERTANKRFEALNAVRGEVITYRGTLPILPYFSCSAGFTRSAAQRRWRTDTPYLTSVLDVASCDNGNFNGHGVGLSGKWAQTLAELGATYRDILTYYYAGIEITR